MAQPGASGVSFGLSGSEMHNGVPLGVLGIVRCFPGLEISKRADQDQNIRFGTSGPV